MVKLTPIAKQLQKLLIDHPNGGDTNKITLEINKENNYIQERHIKRTLERYPEFFLEEDGMWRLKAIVEEDKHKEESKRRINK
ncbi:hypothetical protein NBRC111894_4238 [Sporolactobacillus inulinus]|uniref:Uncharacterized protein n=1 Tax=Sporolactobacillus inulinus TaxID=2078 RepID=A0A4Y1ZID1_9BACL|nr:hypothetical protein [Sporolactobacillus inulinus]GAY78684.1 hypothetical protein NBRC111894_4238 [Sporolactobacillus inulinus]